MRGKEYRPEGANLLPVFGGLLNRLIETQWERCMRESPSLRRSVRLSTHASSVIQDLDYPISSGRMSEILSGKKLPGDRAAFMQTVKERFLLNSQEGTLMEELLEFEAREREGIQVPTQNKTALLAANLSVRLGVSINADKCIEMYHDFLNTGMSTLLTPES